MNYARLEHSPRLRKLMAYMADGKERSTLEIIRDLGICAVNSAMAELRRNGIPISRARRDGTTPEGNAVYKYQWEKAA